MNDKPPTMKPEQIHKAVTITYWLSVAAVALTVNARHPIKWGSDFVPKICSVAQDCATFDNSGLHMSQPLMDSHVLVATTGTANVFAIASL